MSAPSRDAGRAAAADVMSWVTSRDTGMSSLAIWSHMMTGAVAKDGFGARHPHDADDFGRCYRLLAIAPAWKARIGEMARYSAEWAALTAHWRQLSEMYEAAAVRGGDWTRWKPLCDTMSDLLTSARVCADCGVVGMYAWTTYHDGTMCCSPCARKRDGAKPAPSSPDASPHRHSVVLP